jgi:transposase-like protein
MGCKHCGSEEKVKNGYVKGKQRYECKSCKRTYREGDKRSKYSIEKKIKVIRMYLEGMGICAIGRLEDMPASLVVHWVRQQGKLVEEYRKKVEAKSEKREIEVMELDEL